MAKYEYWLTDEGLIQLTGWARKGLPEKVIAKDKMHISRSTLAVWKKKFKKLKDALSQGKEVADLTVEDALYNRAVGISTTLLKPIKTKKTEYDEKTGKKIKEWEEVIYVQEEVYIPPDIKAIQFWLINRKPEDWKQKVEIRAVEDTDNDVGVIQIEAVEEEHPEDTKNDRGIIDGEYKEIREVREGKDASDGG